MDRFSVILAEQSSPAEVLVFLAVTVAIFLAVAFLVYASIMFLLRAGLPERVPLRRVLFPGTDLLRENLGDYVLAASTSLLLALTLMVKHDLVEQIRNFDMARVQPEGAAILFDFGLPAGLAAQISEATLGDVVQPLLEAGKVEASDLLVRDAVERLPKSWLTPAVLIGAGIVLTLFYLLWLARRRYLALKKSPDSAPKYTGVVRPLLTLAVCIGLLLASSLPLAEGGENLLVRSALDAIREAGEATDPQASRLSRLIRGELRKQRQRAAFLYCAECDDPRASIPETTGGASGAPDGLGPLVKRVDEASAACRTACDAQLADMQAFFGPLRARLTDQQEQLNDIQRQLAEVREREVPQPAGDQAAEREALSRRIAELEQQVTRLGRQIDAAGATPAPLDELGRRVAWLESQHRENTATAQPVNDRLCAQYARQAVEMQRRNLEAGCNLTGARWSEDFEAHYNWCVGVPASLRLVENRARETELNKCRSTLR